MTTALSTSTCWVGVAGPATAPSHTSSPARRWRPPGRAPRRTIAVVGCGRVGALAPCHPPPRSTVHPSTRGRRNTTDLLERVQRAVVAHGLFAPRARIVVGVSGGADSVALLHLLCALRSSWHLTLHVAHLDHGLRHDAAEDAAFVRRLSTDWRLPSTIERRDVGALCAREGWSLEDGARRIRYEFFQAVAHRVSATAIALAHTADDQAETVLMRLIRGTGLTGLGAIPVKRSLGAEGVWVVRPLLDVWRREILAYLTQEGLAFREDATNHDERFIRNRIRHHLLPLLEREYNPNVKGALTQLAEQSACEAAFLQQAAARQWRRTVKVKPPAQVSIAVAAFLRQPKALQRQLVRQSIQQVQGNLRAFEFRHWREIERLFLERPVGTLVDLPGGVRLRRERDRVVCALTACAPRP